MPTYVLLSRLEPDLSGDAGSFRRIAETVRQTIRTECPQVIWKESFVTFGRFDVLDIFEAPNEVEAQKVAMIIRRHARTQTETMQAMRWQDFLDNL
jgi:uncharacterized protein with GYD domain